jgi:hypothetical protein
MRGLGNAYLACDLIRSKISELPGVGAHFADLTGEEMGPGGVKQQDHNPQDRCPRCSSKRLKLDG